MPNHWMIVKYSGPVLVRVNFTHIEPSCAANPWSLVTQNRGTRYKTDNWGRDIRNGDRCKTLIIREQPDMRTDAERPLVTRTTEKGCSSLDWRARVTTGRTNCIYSSGRMEECQARPHPQLSNVYVHKHNDCEVPVLFRGYWVFLYRSIENTSVYPELCFIEFVVRSR